MGTGRKTVVVGQVIDPVTWGNPLWDQSVQCFASDADRTAQYPPVQRHEGAVTWLEDVNRLDVWNGGAWVPVDHPSDRSDPFATDALWNVNESTVIRIGTWWHLHLWLINKNGGTFSVGAVPIGVLPVTARQSGSYASAMALPVFPQLSGEGGARVGGGVVTWATGAVTWYNLTATPVQPVAGFSLRIDASWPAV